MSELKRLPKMGDILGNPFVKDWSELTPEEKKEVKRRDGFSEDACVVLM